MYKMQSIAHANNIKYTLLAGTAKYTCNVVFLEPIIIITIDSYVGT